MSNFINAGMAKQAERLDVAYHKPSFRGRLEEKRDHLTKQLQEVQNALDALDSSPEVARVVEAVINVNIHY
jgi:hypothetical protein